MYYHPAGRHSIRVTGAGAAGWRIRQNAGQTILTRGLPSNGVATGFDWTRLAQSFGVVDLAASADGMRLIAVTGSAGGLRVSSDGGATWSQPSGTPALYRVASSADGLKLIGSGAPQGGGSFSRGPLWTSSDGGLTWTARPVPPDQFSRTDDLFTDVASSADGTRLFASRFDGGVWRSTDSGVTWTLVSGFGGTGGGSLAASADGLRIVAGYSGGGVRMSVDGGLTWPRSANIPAANVAISADGSTVYATSGGKVVSPGIFVSTDAGLTWNRRTSGSAAWGAVATSADGRIAIVQGPDNTWYRSDNYGQTWSTRQFFTTTMNSVWLTSNGSQAFGGASATVAGVYTSIGTGDRTTPGATGSITGGQYDAIELQHLGGGVFIVISFSAGGTGQFLVQ